MTTKLVISDQRFVHYLHGFNLLSNYDRHFEFPIVVAGIGQLRITYLLDGASLEITDSRDWAVLKEDRPVQQIPIEATNVVMGAKARVVIRVTHPEREVIFPISSNACSR
jgi:hypothetical protein